MRNAIITIFVVSIFTLFRCLWVIDVEATEINIILINSCFGTCELSKEKVLELFLYFVPCILFQMVQGIEIYKHYAIAGIYDIVRRPHRKKWFLKEAVKILPTAALSSLCFVCLGVTLSIVVKTGVGFSGRILAIMFFETIIMMLYLFAMAVLTNSISMLCGSKYGFAITALGQFIMISVLTIFGIGGSLDFMNSNTNRELAAVLFKMNPISQLLLDVHGTTGEGIENVLGNPYGLNFPLWQSLIYMVVLSVVSLAVSTVIAGRIEMLGGNKG